ncbi:Hypothetical predicted protein [Octopus vulgaris]|uniref:Uncharacterized protein n=1 Tax=Octopus vulgaris TaxID=6645 RepID=A0AA36AI69_OCTVU|nr:Hypothetical predicted protein [Octopus vulgaris]
MIATFELSNPATLWEKYQEALSEHILHKMRLAHPGLEFNPQIANLAFCEIEVKVMNLSQKDLSHFSLPKPKINWTNHQTHSFVRNRIQHGRTAALSSGLSEGP